MPSRYSTLSPLPERISRLDELAVDLWWSWQPDARAVFRRLDYTLWRATAHNPVRMLWVIPRQKLEAAAQDPEFLRRYDRAIAALDAARLGRDTWWADSVSALRAPFDRVLLGRVRAPSVAADLRRRPRRAGRRSLQGSQRPGHSADWRRIHVPAGVLPSARLGRRLAGRELRAPQLGGCADRAGDHARRQAVHHRGAARRPHGARGGVARPSRAREAVSARHRSRGERAVGSRAVGAALRRRPRNTHPAGDHPRDRRRPGAEGARIGSGRVSPQRRPRRVRRPAADPRSHRAGLELRSGARRDSRDDGVHDAHAGRRRATTPSRFTSSKSTSRAAGARSASNRDRFLALGLVRQRQRHPVQHDRARAALGRQGECGQPAARAR